MNILFTWDKNTLTEKKKIYFVSDTAPAGIFIGFQIFFLLHISEWLPS